MQSLSKRFPGVSGPQSCISNPERSCELVPTLPPPESGKALTVSGLLSPPPRAVSLPVLSGTY